MNILIVIDVLNGHNGTLKIMRNIAQGFRKNHNVRIIFFGRSNDYKNVLSLFDGFNYDILYSRYFCSIEKFFKVSITKKHTNLRDDDIPSFLTQFYMFKHLKRVSFDPDLIIFSNIFSSLSLILNDNKKSAVILHEAPLFDDFNFFIKNIMHIYVDMIGKRAKYLSISDMTTQKTNRKFKLDIVTNPPLAFSNPENDLKKEKIVLLDTRWTADRDPLFAIELAKKINGLKIVMHGVFTDEAAYKKLKDEITSKGYNIELIANDSEEDLEDLYKRAFIVLRWSGIHETGNSLSIMNAISYGCIPVIDENLGSSGFIRENISIDLVVKKDPECFSNIILKLMNDEDYYKNILRKVIDCKRKFSWENYANDILNDLSPLILDRYSVFQ
jgi:glycosyltransferase involved in cell wall biosynthesis